MLDGVQIDFGAFLARQLYSAVGSTKGRIVIRDIITTIASSLGVEPNLEDRFFGFEQLDQAAFKLMNFCKVDARHLCWIYPGDRLLLLPNVEQTIVLHRANLHWVPGGAEVVHPAPPSPFTNLGGPNSSSQPSSTDFEEVQATLRSIQEKQVFLRSYVASENATLCDFVQE